MFTQPKRRGLHPPSSRRPAAGPRTEARAFSHSRHLTADIGILPSAAATLRDDSRHPMHQAFRF